MHLALKKTLLGLLIIAALLFGTGMFAFKYYFSQYYFGFFPFLILLFFLINAGFFVFFHRSLRKTPNQFVRNFMASTGIKLVVYFLIILFYIFTSPKTAIPFAITLSIAYIAFTAYDLVVMLSLIKTKKEN
jgi:hypothetical protein